MGDPCNPVTTILGNRVPAAVLGCLALAATAACAPELDEELWWGEPPEVEAAVSVGSLIPTDTVDLPPDFSRVVQAAFIDSFRIALVDLADCHVWIVSLDGSRSPLNQTCGGGPGELIRPVTVAARNDGGLLVIDGGTGSAVVSGLDLEEESRVALPSRVAAEYSYSASTWADDSLAVSLMAAAGPDIPPESPRTALAAVVGLGESPGSRPVAGRLPPITTRLETSSGAIAVSCSAPGGKALLIVNPWAFEVMLLPHGEEAGARYYSWRLEGDVASVHPGPAASPVSSVVASGIACGETAYFVTQVHSAAPERRDGALTIRREIRTYDGDVLFRDVSSGPDAAALWLPVAAVGGDFFVTSTDDRYAGFIVRAHGEPSDP